MLSDKELYTLYIEKNLTRKQIAEMLNLKESVIKRFLMKYNIKKPQFLQNINDKKSKTNGYHWYNNGIIQTLSKECPKGYVEGCLPLKENDNRKKCNLTELGYKNICKKGKGKGKKVSEETKNKISEYWKEHEHPLTGKIRSDEVRKKISDSLLGRKIGSKKIDSINSLTYDNCINCLNEDKTINYNKICELLDVLNNEDTVYKIKDKYNFYDIKYSPCISTSNFEKEIVSYIKSKYNDLIILNDRKVIFPNELDIYIPDKNLAIECNGIYWHRVEYEKTEKGFKIKANTKDPQYHFKKSIKAMDNGIRLIHIWEDQWYDQRLQPILKSIIDSALGIDEVKRIYARKCIIKDVSKEEYKNFCDLNHTQLSQPAEVRLGLYYDNTLVQVASFSKYKKRNVSKQKNIYEWEWIRGCEAFNHQKVIGGVSKLFKYFIKKYDPNSILCYSDFNFFNGKGYLKSGFTFEGYTGANKFYIQSYPLKRINRSASRYREYMQKVIEGKLYCCYGAGNLKFVWYKK